MISDMSFQDRDTLVEDLLRLLEQGSPNNNVKIQLKEGEIEASKEILTVRSVYFATMFSNNKFIEGETSSVDMSHCSKAVMEKIIKFLFSAAATFRDLNFLQLLELSHIAEMMLLTKLKVKVDEYLYSYLSTRPRDEYLQLDIIRGRGKDVKFLLNLIFGLKLAYEYNLSSIGESIMQWLHLNLEVIPNDIACAEAFKSLPFNLIRGIFLYEATASCVPTTKQRFDAFMVWLSKNEVTQEDKIEIVESLSFEDFTVEELMISVRDSDLYPGTKIDERVLELYKDLGMKKDLKIQEQDAKISQLNLKIQEQQSSTRIFPDLLA